MKFTSKQPHFEYLKKKWVDKNAREAEKFLDKHGDMVRRFAVGGLGGVMLMSTPGMAGYIPGDNQLTSGGGITSAEDKNVYLAKALKEVVPEEVRKLSVDEENKIVNVLSDELGIKAVPELEGIRLNRSYGLIGGEQHLYRYPGDNLYKHAENASDWAMYGPSGIAPGLGAWGYFATSEGTFTKQDRDNERYYLAIQTFLAPGFAENTAKYRDFFKFRKMLVVNPKTGQTVVAVIGDAGPAEWTGKHLGGSPEVMHFLGLAGGSRKGPVLYFFLDDPQNLIPLGPITVKKGEV